MQRHVADVQAMIDEIDVKACSNRQPDCHDLEQVSIHNLIHACCGGVSILILCY